MGFERTGCDAAEIDELRARIESAGDTLTRLNADPEDVRRAVLKLVLSLVEFVRRLLERQAIRRMEAETLTDDQVESLGVALMRVEEAIADIATRFDLDPDDLNLDLGPLGRLL